MNKYYKYVGEDFKKQIENWHKNLNDRDNSQARKDRAVLRRCKSLYEVLLQSPFYEFKQKFDSFIPDDLNRNERLLTLACIAGLLSHVKENTGSDSKNFAAQLYGEDKNKPLVSELRFNQLQKIKEWEDFYRHLRRCMAVLGEVNIVSLTNDIVHWGCDLNNESKRNIDPTEKLNICWAIDYYKSLPNI